MTALLLGITIAAALWLVIQGIWPSPPTPTSLSQRALARLRRIAGLHKSAAISQRRRHLLLGLLAGIGGWLFTGWIILVLLTPLAFLVLPPLLGRPTTSLTLAKLTALETWCRSIAGLMASRTGLEAAIHASVHSAPPVIRPAVADLSARVSAQVPLERAMRAFADDIDDPLADTIAAAITIGGQRRAHRGGGGTASALTELAHSVAAEVTSRTSIETERAGPRNSVRLITLIALLATAAGFASRSYMEPYSTPVGQVILLVLGLLFLACLLWIRRITAGESTPRLHQQDPALRQQEPEKLGSR